MTVTISQFRTSTGREPTEAEKIAILLRSTYSDPNKFNDLVLGRTYRKFDGTKVSGEYWHRQKEICESVVKHRTTVVPTGNSTGKSYLSAGLILWWLYTRVRSLVIVTAPSQTLLGSVVFKEVRRAHVNSRVRLAGTITDSPKASPQTLVVDSTGWQCIGFATRGVERLSGQHAPELLVLVDEASGVEDEIFQALDSLNASKLVYFGNPIRAEGRFRELSLRARREKDDASIPDSERVHEIRISTLESPDVHMDRSERGLADRGFLVESERQYGVNSLWWRTHILAEFPDLSYDSLLDPKWLDACAAATRKPGIISGHTRMGVDLGEGVGRDRSVICVRDDLGILEIFTDNLAGPQEVSEHIQRLKFKWGIAEHRISYDKSGMIGKDLERYLEARFLYGVQPYTGSMSGTTDFVNLRAYCGWQLRKRLDPGTTLGGPPNPKTGMTDLKFQRVKQDQFVIPNMSWWPSLMEELLMIQYELHGGRTKLEAKEDLKKRLGRSPYLADALLQTFRSDD